MADQSAGENQHVSISGGLAGLLQSLGIAVAFTSYQSGLLYLLGRNASGAHLHQAAIGRPMGLARCGERGLVLTTGHQIIRFENPLEAHEKVNNQFDACFVPRTTHLTGELDAHDVGVEADGGIVFVNTRLNCLARPDMQHSFAPVWRPPFISALVDEDRCHLNGLAMRDGKPAYVTAASRSDTVDGWRDRRADGGVVIDVATGEIVCEGLSMPHSPRWYRGELWVLNSGTGELGVVEGLGTGKPRAAGKARGKFVPRVFCPGFVRGLAFHGDYAVVGLSKPRYQRFEGLALDQRLKDADSEPWCGIQIIDIRRGVCVEWLRIDGAVAELYDVEVLPGLACPMAISPSTPEAVQFVTWEGRIPLNPAPASARPPVPSGEAAPATPEAPALAAA
ncbi:MAG: TIGR03032 family protein [Erythrobacter sp.]